MSGILAAPAFAHVPPPPGGGCRQIRGAQTPDNPDDDVSVCRQDVYFHKGSAPVGNLAEADEAAIPSWDETKPEGELVDAGVYASSSDYDVIVEQGGAAGRPQFVGTFTGPIDTVGFRMYLREPIAEFLGSLNAVVHLEIDGEVLYDNWDGDGVGLALSGPDHEIYRIDAAFTNVYATMQSYGLDLSPTKEHTVKFGIIGWNIPSEGLFLYDAGDVAAGLMFNLEPTSMAGFTKINIEA
jgi:hypothetical protein